MLTAREDGQDGKKGKKITKLKQPKYQKPKDENMGRMNETFVFFFYTEKDTLQPSKKFYGKKFVVSGFVKKM